MSDDLLEAYCFGRLDDSQLGVFEEHILACHSCQDRLEETEQFITVMKAATAGLPAVEPQSSWREFISRLFAVPRPVWAGAIAVAAVLLLMIPMRRPDSQRVDLTAYRGAEASIGAKAGTPLELTLDASGLAPAEYRIDLANSRGAVVWTGEATVDSARLTAEVPDQLSAGQYWVRVYAKDQAADPVREYGLKLE